MTTRPVTQVAEVAVNSAFTNPRLSVVVAEGSINRVVPNKMRLANPVMEMRAGDWISDRDIRIVKASYPKSFVAP